MKEKRIKSSNIQSRLDLSSWVVLYLLLERFNANDLWFGAFYCFCGLNIIAVIWSWFYYENVDIFKQDK